MPSAEFMWQFTSKKKKKKKKKRERKENKYEVITWKGLFVFQLHRFYPC